MVMIDKPTEKEMLDANEAWRKRQKKIEQLRGDRKPTPLDRATNEKFLEHLRGVAGQKEKSD
jgi:hypothetical protein